MGLCLRDNLSDSFLIDVYWDEELLCSVYKKLFLKELSALASTPSRQEFLQVFALLETKLAKRTVVHVLAKKGYLSQELQKKLTAKGFSKAAIEHAIAFGQSGGFIDDEQELKRVIRSELRKGRGSQAILFKLKQKRVPEEQLHLLREEILKGEKQALEDWMRKRGISKDVSDRKQRQKLYAQLMRRGFSSEAIRSVLNDDWH